jgi:hypothetical protein
MDDLPIIELRTRVSAAKEGDNMNNQIQGLGEFFSFVWWKERGRVTVHPSD